MKRVLGLVFVLLLAAATAEAAVAVSGLATSACGLNGTSLTWSHTTSSGDLLVVGVGRTTVSSVTYGGQALTRAVSVSGAELWWRAITTGNIANIVVTVSSQSNNCAGALNFSGAGTTSPFSATATNTGGGTATTVGPITGNTTGMFVDVLTGNLCDNSTVGSGQTERIDASNGANCFRMSTAPGTGASTSMTGTLNNSTSWSAAMGSIVTGAPPDTTPPTQPGSFTASGVTSQEVDLLWTASTDAGTVTYHVERSPSGCASFAEITTTLLLTYADTGLAASTTFCYRVRGVDDSGNVGSYTSNASAATLATRQATLRWTDNATTEDGFLIRRCLVTTGTCVPSVTLVQVTSNTVVYVDTTSPQPIACYDLQSTLAGTGGSTFPTAVCTTATSLLVTPSNLTVVPLP